VININLLPSAQRGAGVAFDPALRRLLWLLAIVVVVAIVGHIWQTLLVNNYNNQISSWNDKIAQVQAQVKEVDDLRDQVEQLKAKAELLERIKQSPLQLAEILADLGDVTPTSVWFSGLTLNHAGGSATVTGKTSTLRDVADLMLNLDSSPVFGNATLTSTAQPGGNNAPGAVTFSVIGQLSPAVSGQ